MQTEKSTIFWGSFGQSGHEGLSNLHIMLPKHRLYPNSLNQITLRRSVFVYGHEKLVAPRPAHCHHRFFQAATELSHRRSARASWIFCTSSSRHITEKQLPLSPSSCCCNSCKMEKSSRWDHSRARSVRLVRAA